MHYFVSWTAISLATPLFALALGVVDVHAAVTPAQACAIAKNKAAVKQVSASAKCWQKAIARGEAAASPDCLAAATGKFVAAIAKADSKDGCLVTGDAGTIGGAADACINGIIDATPASSTTTTTTTVPTTTTTLVQPLWYEDADGDGAGNPAVSQYAATAPVGYVPSSQPVDCDDDDPLRYPHRPERCDLVLDSDCNAATPDCPTGCTAVQRPGGNLYMFCSTARDRSQADLYCSESVLFDGELVKIDDASEESFVWGWATGLLGSTGYYWIGGEYVGSSWQWPDGTPMTFTFWLPGEPSMPTINRFSQVSLLNAYWRSAFATTTASYVCERY